GSTLFQPLSDVVGFPLDQINFFLSQIIALICGFIFRCLFSPCRVGANVRHSFEAILGFSLLFFCFGIQSLVVVVQSVICWLIMWRVPHGTSEKLVFLTAMLFLAVCHSLRMYYDYSGYNLDITGPLMINTQRITSLAFSLSDGKELMTDPDIRTTPYIFNKTISELPSILELLSYSLSFHMIICGPFSFYKEYINFIHGNNITYQPLNALFPVSTIVHEFYFSNYFKKLSSVAVFLVLMAVCTPMFPAQTLIDETFNSSHSLPYRIIYCVISTSAARFKYYVAWKLAEAINVAAGLGFGGVDQFGRQRWDFMDNVSVFKVEFATSIRTLLSNWNSRSTLWLRHVVYERTHNTLAVFAMSALWHGFYPGYYVTFMTGAFLVYESRMVRPIIRPKFQSSAVLSKVYDLLTFCSTKLALTYLAVPFLLLEF
ncbi:hypothetical protein HELRODRAFT_121109, partial [Helobdella robusta]|uniref:Uncharacterized protein n=1 Tax=Helobdella robusta TaxID=6412 RepID=T1EGR0_HELRO